jgi:hypothetical protein
MWCHWCGYGILGFAVCYFDRSLGCVVGGNLSLQKKKKKNRPLFHWHPLIAALHDGLA